MSPSEQLSSHSHLKLASPSAVAAKNSALLVKNPPGKISCRHSSGPTHRQTRRF